MTFMVGIGPFIVIPFIIRAMGGPQCIFAWVVGAGLAAVDGCVWAELGAAMPQAGGSYVFLREAYGANSWGRLLSFLFIWQTLFQAPLSISSGALGFADYSKYLTAKVPGVTSWLDREYRTSRRGAGELQPNRGAIADCGSPWCCFTVALRLSARSRRCFG